MPNDHPARHQALSWTATGAVRRRFAPARTYGFLKDPAHPSAGSRRACRSQQRGRRRPRRRTVSARDEVVRTRPLAPPPPVGDRACSGARRVPSCAQRRSRDHFELVTASRATGPAGREQSRPPSVRATRGRRRRPLAGRSTDSAVALKRQSLYRRSIMTPPSACFASDLTDARSAASRAAARNIVIIRVPPATRRGRAFDIGVRAQDRPVDSTRVIALDLNLSSSSCARPVRTCEALVRAPPEVIANGSGKMYSSSSCRGTPALGSSSCVQLTAARSKGVSSSRGRPLAQALASRRSTTATSRRPRLRQAHNVARAIERDGSRRGPGPRPRRVLTPPDQSALPRLRGEPHAQRARARQDRHP